MGFVPTRDLPRWRPQPSLDDVAEGLRRLSLAAGLGRQRQVDLCPDSRDVESCSVQGSDAELQDSEGSNVEEEFEARFARSWLTQAISSTWLQEQPSTQEQAAEILAALCGRPASTADVTAFKFSPNLRVLIQDSPVTADALGNRTWGAAPLLARRLVSQYLSESRDVASCSRRSQTVLELGAGTGLVGLALAAAARSSERPMHMDLTDYHPHVIANLTCNVRLNGLNEERSASCTRVSRLDWQAVHENHVKALQGTTGEPLAQDSPQRYVSTAQTLPEVGKAGGQPRAVRIPSFDEGEHPEAYDVIIAADCVYDVNHPAWIRSVAQRYLRRPKPDSPDPSLVRTLNPHGVEDHSGGTLYLISPIRATHTAEIEAITAAFPASASSQPRSSHPSASESEAQLRIVSQVDETGYDDFGPLSLNLGMQSGSAKRGLKTTYRTFVVRWT
ncbi:unnamed protein product [Parajaminaea phylloscopi]